MSLTMPSPWKHPTTGFYYLRQRVPADLQTKARGQIVDLFVDGVRQPVKVGTMVKVSLRTKEPGRAKLRYREADDSLQACWSRLRSDCVELTHKQTLALSGQIYGELVAKFDDEPGTAAAWQRIWALCTVALEGGAVTHDTLAPDNRETLEAAFGRVSDRWLMLKGLQITPKSRDRLLVEVARAVADAADDIRKKAEGDYRLSTVAERFPSWKPVARAVRPADGGQTITGLFERWKEEQALGGSSGSTARRWEPVIRSFVAFVGHDDAESATADDVRNWRQSVLSSGSTIPRTFNRVHLAAIRSIFNLGRGAGLIASNPAQGLKFPTAEALQTRPKGFTNEEALTILRAAQAAPKAPGKTSDIMRRVQRWVPWLCAYTGARVGEITQLRGTDVTLIDGIACIRITPEAGTVKTGQYRDVPLHPHLLELDFFEFARRMGDGPLFYSTTMKSKTPWAITANKLAAWVRETAGVTDPKVKPNHGWRHAFKTVGRHVGIDRFYLNGICGQSIGTTEGDKYGDTPMPAVLREIQKFPRWEV